MNVDIERIKFAYSVEMESYLWETWKRVDKGEYPLKDDGYFTPRYYTDKIRAYDSFCKAAGIPVESVWESDNGAYLPIGLKVEGSVVRLKLDIIRLNYEKQKGSCV